MQAGKGDASAGQGEGLSKGNRAVMLVRRMWGGGTLDISPGTIPNHARTRSGAPSQVSWGKVQAVQQVQ